MIDQGREALLVDQLAKFILNQAFWLECALEPHVKHQEDLLWEIGERKGRHIACALPSNRFEALSGDRAGQFSSRINQQWRICFEWSGYGPENVEIVDYH